jgi:flagellar protein FliS
MKLSQRQLSYQRSAIEGASPIGLVVVLFDTLAGDLRRAAAALRKDDIETRSKELSHAALVLGQLESWIDPQTGAESAQVLSRFYADLRAKMMQAAVTKSAVVLDTQVDMILHVRSAWQQLDTAPPQPADNPAELSGEPMSTHSTLMRETTLDRKPFSHSA